jgi:hypothetical protein
MKRAGWLTVLAVLLLRGPCLFPEQAAQRSPIERVKHAPGYRYTYQAMPLRTWSDFSSVMRDSPDALRRLNRAKRNRVAAGVLGGAGGFLIGWPIGQAVAHTVHPAWPMAAAGAGLVAVGIGFDVASNKQLSRGVDLYNASLTAGQAAKPDLSLALTASGVSLRLRF